MRELLAKGANTEAVDKYGMTALHLAAGKGYVASVREAPGEGRGGGTGVEL